MKKRKSYNPWLLPPWLRKCRFYCRGIILPLTIFQGLRTLFFPTTWDFLFLLLLGLFTYLFFTDFI
ncbi:hypothetical protein JOD29_000173 [Lysinibacillus composti]|uniref:Uncharacterized protein n=1 Tax=Lysinibacillus composti TaxID=720633 RepID=A0A3N9UKP8_9BACI|nr:hypothetical protein [Lysinibacillus composti]MBM7606936.1 hypothetical protein [Lysinibacillus composti]RQW76461.1 hypothetical protein EBB45_02615 [Lysinibacillus composti]